MILIGIKFEKYIHVQQDIFRNCFCEKRRILSKHPITPNIKQI